jgi:hypothetical protein
MRNLDRPRNPVTGGGGAGGHTCRTGFGRGGIVREKGGEAPSPQPAANTTVYYTGMGYCWIGENMSSLFFGNAIPLNSCGLYSVH